jgi:hypothetical protein
MRGTRSASRAAQQTERSDSIHQQQAAPGAASLAIWAVPAIHHLTRLPRAVPQIDMATLPYLTLQDLRDLPIHAVGPRRKLLAALERM